MSTLVIRFVGVFIVLAILMIGMQLLGSIVSRLVSQEGRRKKEAERQKEPGLAEAPELELGEEEIAAAIGAAIAFSMESGPFVRPIPRESTNNGTWALAGRIALMGRRLSAGTQKRTH